MLPLGVSGKYCSGYQGICFLTRVYIRFRASTYVGNSAQGIREFAVVKAVWVRRNGGCRAGKNKKMRSIFFSESSGTKGKRKSVLIEASWLVGMYHIM